MPPTLVLASASPRRRLLIHALGLPVEQQAAELPEVPGPGEAAVDAALRLAGEKAEVVSAEVTSGVVVAGDTIVVSGEGPEERILGKPVDPTEAREMLRGLRGRAHRVITGVWLVDIASAEWYSEAVVTRVWMREYSDEEVEEYVASGSPLDKAGAYGIQDPFRPVERIEGCYLNVVGLPLCAVARGLRALGHAAPGYPEDACRCEEWRDESQAEWSVHGTAAPRDPSQAR